MLRARWFVGLLICAVTAAGVAGCGSSGSSGGPLQTELSYLPAASPLVVTFQTDPNSAAIKNTMSFLGRFPFTPVLESAVITRLKQAGVDYYADVKPLLGNPVVIAGTGPTLSGSGSRRFVLVWVTKSASTLSSLVKKTSSTLRNLGSRDGATVYSGQGTSLAVDGATLILAPNRDTLFAALDRHAKGGGIAMTDYTRNTSGLPADAEIQASGSVQQLLTGNPRARSALKIPWVASIRGYGVSIGVAPSGVTVRYHVDTSGSSLTASQLPLSSAAGAPELPTGFPLVAGLRDPQHLIGFIESAEQVASPAKWAKFQSRQAALRAKTGADINQLLHQLTGTLAIANDLHATFGRAEVANPTVAASTLAKLAKDPRDAFQTGTVLRTGNTYVFKRPGGDVILELVGNRVVVGSKATPEQVRAFATAPSAAAAGAQGPAAFTLGLPQILATVTRHGSTRIPPAVVNLLGNLTGSASNTASGLDGSASLAIK